MLQYASDLIGTTCHVRDLLLLLYLPVKQCVRSLSAHNLGVSVSRLNFLKWETSTFILSGLRPKHPDLNPMNYKICAEMQESVYLKQFITCMD